MMMGPFVRFSVCLLVVVVVVFVPECHSSTYFPTETMGCEVINLVPLNGPVIAFANQLSLYDDNTNTSIKRIYFLADKSPSNMWGAEFDEKGGPNSFWISDSGNVQDPTLGPFISFDVVGNNFVGVALPSNVTLSRKGVVIQSIYNGTQPPEVSQVDARNGLYNFFSVYIPRSNNTNTTTDTGRFVYFAGWDTDNTTSTITEGNFVVVRGTIKLGTPHTTVAVYWGRDVLRFKLPCFDQFSVRSRPRMTWIDSSGGYLIVAVPGICPTFVKIVPSQSSADFSQSQMSKFNPTNSPKNYVSSVDIDTNFNLIYYVLKEYRSNKTNLLSVSTDTLSTTQLNVPLGLDESDAMVVVGNESSLDQSYNWLFVIAQGSNKMMRLKIVDNNVADQYYATLGPSFNKISSALYYSPYLYFVTYEPDAKLGRIKITSFCASYCGEKGYCSMATCICQNGFVNDPLHVKGCIPLSEANLEESEIKENSATVALAILFSLSLVGLVSGWGCWWINKKGQYSAV